MRIQKRLLALLTALLLFAAGLPVCAGGLPVPDLQRSGSIGITMRYQGGGVSGGTLTLYRVGAVEQWDGWNYRFALTGDFLPGGFDLADVTSPELASELSTYAVLNRLEGTTKEIDQSGYVGFEALEPGLYLLAQHEPADGFESVEPFLVSLPMREHNGYIYDVDASPKAQLCRRGDVPAGTPPPPGGPLLPQTGQLNWPIPLLVVAGLLLFALGWKLRFGKERADNEK